jgi:hypothetical protein
MPPPVHAFMQYAHDLDKARLQHAIEDDMHWARDAGFAALVPAVADMKAARTWKQMGAVGGQWPVRTSRDVAHRGGQKGTVSGASLPAMHLLAPPQDREDIRLGRLG